MPELLTVPEVAAWLGVSTWGAYDMARRGVLPVVRLGRHVRIQRAGLAELAGISYTVAAEPKSALYKAFEPILNAGGVVLLDVSVLEQQLLGLVRRGGPIDHQRGEHYDYANAVVGVVRLLSAARADAQAAEVTRMRLSIGNDEPRPACSARERAARAVQCRDRSAGRISALWMRDGALAPIRLPPVARPLQSKMSQRRRAI